MRWFYTLVFSLLLPFIVLRLLWRSRLAPEYRKRMGERFGWFSAHRLEPSGGIWLHCVSVGETIAAAPLVERLLESYPEMPLVITSTTPTGSAQVSRLWGDRSNRVSHCYVPYDLPWCIKGFLNRFKPRLALVMETEVWPNSLHQCGRYGIPSILVNARMSEKSYRGYQRFAALFRPVFSGFTQVLAQAMPDKNRLQALGVQHASITGSLKSDFQITESMRAQAADMKAKWQEELGQTCRFIIAASTHRGEDELILDALQELKSQQESQHKLLLLLAPRHPERFDEVYQLCQRHQLNTCKRSAGERLKPTTDILLCDTLGELATLLGTADIAIMGGTFVQHGGHNFIEPAAWGLPQLAGQSDYNFATIAPDLVKTGALEQLQSGAQLSEALQHLLQDADVAQQRGQAALAYVEAHRGAVDKTIAAIAPLISQEI